MSTIDQFESVFRSAVKESYQPTPFPLRELLLVTDLSGEEEGLYLAEVKRFFEGLSARPQITSLSLEQTVSIGELVDLIKARSPDLIITYRGLHDRTEDFPFSLGDHVEVLTQVTDVPILLFPALTDVKSLQLRPPARVMVLTDQLIEHPQLIDAGLSMMQSPGQLTLAHVEDEAVFERYMKLIGKIPQIDTDVARTLIKEQMLAEVSEYIKQTRDALAEQEMGVTVHELVKMGHQLQQYKSLVGEHHIELVVMQTKDDGQVAMHGLSYPLAVELSKTPLLML